jgi:TP901 family phage tail tape measure protein
MATADIGIRVFLEDAASAALFAISSQLGMLGVAAKTASGGFAGLSASIAGLAVIAGFVVSLFLFGAAIKYSVDQAMALQTSMFGVAVATHVPLAVAMAYTNQLMNLGAASIFSTQQIADGIGILGRAGFTLQDIMGKTADGMHGIAAAGVALSIAIRTDAVQGFNILSQVMSAYQVPAKDALATADLLQFAFEHQTSTVAQFGAGLAQVTPIAHLMGVPLTEIVAALDVLGPAMKNTSTAGTAMRYTIAGLYQPTAAAQKAMVDLKLATIDAGGNFHSVFFDAQGKAVDFVQAIQILRDHLKGLSQEAQLNALRQLFSVRGGQGADILIQQIQKVMHYLDLLNKSHDNAGGAMSRWQQVMSTAEGAIQGFQTSIQDLGAAIGLQFFPMVTEIATKLNGFVSALRATVLANPAATAEFLKVGAAVSALGVALGIVLLFLLPITQPFMVFAAIIAGVVLGVIGLTLAIMAAIHWWQAFINSSNPVAAVLRAIWVTIVSMAKDIKDQFGSAWASILVSMQPLVPFLPMLRQLLIWLAIAIGVIIVGAILAVIAIFAAFAGALAQFIAGLASIASGVVQVFNGILLFLSAFWNNIIATFTGNEAVMTLSWGQMGQGLQMITSGMMAIIGGILQATLGSIVAAIGNFAQTFITFFRNLSAQLVGGSIWPDMLNLMLRLLVAALAQMVTATSTGVTRILAVIATLPGKIGAILTTLAGQMFTWGANAMTAFANGLASTIGAVISQVQKAAAAIAGLLAHKSPPPTGPLSNDDTWMPNMMKMFASGITQGTPMLQAAAGRAAGGIASGYYSPSTMLGGQGGGYGGNTTIPLVVDGRVLAEVVLNRMTGQLQMNGMGRSFR